MEKLSGPLKSGNGVYVTVGAEPVPVTETVPLVSFASTLQFKLTEGGVASVADTFNDRANELPSSSSTVAVISLPSLPPTVMTGGWLMKATEMSRI